MITSHPISTPRPTRQCILNSWRLVGCTNSCLGSSRWESLALGQSFTLYHLLSAPQYSLGTGVEQKCGLIIDTVLANYTLFFYGLSLYQKSYHPFQRRNQWLPSSCLLPQILFVKGPQHQIKMFSFQRIQEKMFRNPMCKLTALIAKCTEWKDEKFLSFITKVPLWIWRLSDWGSELVTRSWKAGSWIWRSSGAHRAGGCCWHTCSDWSTTSSHQFTTGISQTFNNSQLLTFTFYVISMWC